MSYFFIGGFALLGALAIYQYVRRMERGRVMRSLRWLIGGGAGIVAGGSSDPGRGQAACPSVMRAGADAAWADAVGAGIRKKRRRRMRRRTFPRRRAGQHSSAGTHDCA
mgnify:CR=1 FL=1